jgi:hypothetical protein
VGLLGQFGHHIHVERLNQLLVEPGVVRFERLDEK